MGRPALEPGAWGKITATRVNGKWRARARYREYSGDAVQVVRWAPTKVKAEQKLQAHLKERTGPKSDATVADLAGRWLRSRAGGRDAANTTRLYELAVSKHVVPELGRLALSEVGTPAVERALVAVQGSAGPGAAKTMRSVLSGMFALAVRQGAMTVNPVREASPIRQDHKQVRALTVPETEVLIDFARSDPAAVALDLPDLIEFMLGTGVRLGEALGLLWPRVALAPLERAGTVDVNATMIRVKGEGLRVQPRTKSAAGVRTLALPGHLVDLLAGRQTLLRVPPPLPVVFSSPTGRLRDPSNTSADLRAMFVRAGFPGLTSHVFRKTVATRLDEAGFSARVIADQLGHQKPSMTQDVYLGRGVVSVDAARALDK